MRPRVAKTLPAVSALYIDLADRPRAETREVAAGVVLDFDAEGRLVGIDLDQASKVVDLTKLVAEELPLGKLAAG